MGSDPPPGSASNISLELDSHDKHGPLMRPNSPEPLSEEDITLMRNRMVDMGLSLDRKSQDTLSAEYLSQREKELGGMVTRLLHSFVDPTQLHRQAEFINWLATQRDHLIQSFEEERRRWEAERENWTRMAEALLSQRARAANSSQRDEDLERQCAAYESENKHLREKLQDSHLRFSALESELNKLKPLLLMQPPFPYTNASSQRQSTSQTGHPIDLGSSKAGRKIVDSTPIEEHDSAATPTKDPSTPQTYAHVHADLTRSQPRSDHYRRQSRISVLSPQHSRTSAHSTPGRSVFSATQTPSTHAHSPRKSRSKHKRLLSNNLLPLTADARTEHLLLAARKIGRERAHTMSGFMRRVEREKEDLMREKEAERSDRGRSDKAATAGIGGNAYYRKDLVDPSASPGSSTASTLPKTPKRNSTGGQHTTHFLTPTLMTPRSDLHPQTNQAPNPFVFVRTPVATNYQTSTTPTPRAANHATSAIHPTAKPAQTSSALSTSTNHPTPLASLLSAARSMMDDESSEPNPTSNHRRRATALEPPESPLSKRRKVGNSNPSNGRGPVDMLSATLTPGLDRARSALDVLADQAAAAFDSDRQSPARSPVKPTAKNKVQDKGKGSARARTRSSVLSEEEREVEPSPKAKGRISHDSHSRATTGSPLSTRSRSKGISMDRLPKESTKVLRHRKNDKSAELQQRNAPPPRMIFSPGSKTSVPSLSSLSPAPSPTPPPTTSGGDKAAGNLTSLVVVESSTTNGDHTSLNGTAAQRFVSPSPCIEDNGHDQPDPPSVNTKDGKHTPNRDAVTPSLISQSTSQAEDKQSAMNDPTMTSVAEISEHNPHGESISGHVPDGKEGTVVLDEAVGIQSHAGRSFVLDEDGHDTDADAEGEMDVDADETVFMESSAMIHDPLSLALPRSQLGSVHTIAMEVSDNEQNFGRS